MIIPQSHRPRPMYGHSRPTSKKWYKENPVCETMVWPLMLKNLVRETEVWSLVDRVKNLTAGIHRRFLTRSLVGWLKNLNAASIVHQNFP